MHYELYTKIIQALIYASKKENPISADILLCRGEDSVNFHLEVNDFVSEFNVKFNDSICIKLSLMNQLVSLNINPEQAEQLESTCNCIAFNDSEDENMEIINLSLMDPTKTSLWVSGQMTSTVITLSENDELESKHFQKSTVKNIPVLEVYSDMLRYINYFSDIIPKYTQFNLRYYIYPSTFNDEFRDFVLSKLWSIINLS